MVQVKDSAAWAIGRVCERCPNVLLNEQCLPTLLTILVGSLSFEPRVAINVCWVCLSNHALFYITTPFPQAFSSLAEAAAEAVNDDEPETFCLSSSFEAIVNKLIEVTDRSDATGNLRSSAYEALMDMIKFSAKVS